VAPFHNILTLLFAPFLINTSFVLFYSPLSNKIVTMTSYKDTNTFSEDPENQVVQGFEINDEITTNAIGYHTNCFGLCCDFRKAVLVVNAIVIVIQFVQMVGLAIIPKFLEDNLDDIEANIQDDTVRQQVDTFAKSDNVTKLVVFLEISGMIGLAFYGIAIYGALKFKQWAITTALVWYSFSLFMQLVVTFMGFGGVLALFLGVLLVYPHFYMLRLMKAGIMTESNYPNIAKCCCGRSR